MHSCPLPLRLGWKPTRLFAQLQKGYPQRPDGKGGVTNCDTWDNAMLHTWTTIANQEVPLRLEMKRLAPGATNTWFIEILGTDGGVGISYEALHLSSHFRARGWRPGRFPVAERVRRAAAAPAR